MSLLPTCCICDALLKDYGGNTRCPRCKLPCPTCGGNVAKCQHPLAQIVEVKRDTDPDTGWERVAA
jgi:hypothetical protein